MKPSISQKIPQSINDGEAFSRHAKVGPRLYLDS